MPAAVAEEVRRALEARAGLVIVAGPAGCGGPETVGFLAAELGASGRRTAHVDAALGADALRAALDDEADAVVLPSLEGAAVGVLAVRAAATSALVVAGMEAADPAGALAALLGLHADPALLGSAFRLGLQQRRLRRLCPDCVRRAPEDRAALEDLRLERVLGGVPLARPGGCGGCRGTGFRGTVDVFEAGLPDDRFRAALAAEASEETLRGLLRGTRPIALEALDRLKEGATTLGDLRERIPLLALLRAADGV
jgi:type II secretory ATPase GspE/PulE/Tfp pilus assembly ATPase PilB-like protein